MHSTTVGPLISDHFTVLCTLNIANSDFDTKQVLTRKIKDMDVNAFKQDITEKMASIDIHNPDINCLVQEVDTCLRNALDEHAPAKSKLVVQKPRSPWITDDIRAAKRERRRIENRLSKDNTKANKDLYRKAKNRVNELLDMAKKLHFQRIIEANRGNSKDLFNTFNALNGAVKASVYPKAESDKDIADQFVKFFKEKIDNISKKFDSVIYRSENIPDDRVFCSFKLLSEEEIRKYILKSPSTTCLLDPIPTDLLKLCLNETLPTITKLVNRCLETGTMPQHFKEALVIPLLKKKNLDIEFKNFRPISNLSFLSKILERIVIDQLSQHCDKHELNEKKQSAYRRGHSTETALLKVCDDILRGFENRQVTSLAMLDLSAAFDTVDHSIFLKRLSTDFGIEGRALEWMKSYLSGRSQQVLVNGTKSEKVSLVTGFPQGGGAGPWAYSRYTQPVANIINLFSILYYFFADDSQIYKSFAAASIGDQERAKTSIEKCIASIAEWMFANRLKLNMDKTEFITFGTRQQLKKLCFDSINVCNETIRASPNVRNLGAHLDQELKMKDHVTQVIKSAYFQIRKIRSVKKYLSKDSVKTLVNCFILSRLDYCNSLLYGISEEYLDRLQKVQNAAARLIFDLRKHDHITGTLKELHWLHVRYRIKYKIALVTYKTLKADGPAYLRELLVPVQNQRAHRSSTKNLLKVPKYTLKYGGKRSFSFAAPTIWNSLPEDLKSVSSLASFKRNLKTFLFRQAYNG